MPGPNGLNRLAFLSISGPKRAYSYGLSKDTHDGNPAHWIRDTIRAFPQNANSRPPGDLGGGSLVVLRAVRAAAV